MAFAIKIELLIGNRMLSPNRALTTKHTFLSSSIEPFHDASWDGSIQEDKNACIVTAKAQPNLNGSRLKSKACEQVKKISETRFLILSAIRHSLI